MTIPEPTFPSTWPDDEHAFCDCGALMSFNASTGQLECGDCPAASVDATVIVDRAPS
jgi:hypothetical protein